MTPFGAIHVGETIRTPDGERLRVAAVEHYIVQAEGRVTHQMILDTAPVA